MGPYLRKYLRPPRFDFRFAIRRPKYFAKRRKEIESYKQYKTEQEKLRREIERHTGAATKIQAWWRGTMVRKGLGKYKKKKEKKVKKKSSEKKSAK